MLATLLLLAQRGTQEAPDEAIGLPLILLGVLIAVAVAVAIFFVFTRMSKRERQTGPDDTPHRSGHVGH
jgi:flagellar basal body-associated protein FliL